MKNLLFASALALFACSNSGTSAEDMARDLAASSGDMKAVSCCGNPGDTGNNFGVGKYCQGIVDCAGTPKTTLCSSLGNTGTRKTFFCTFICDGKSDMGNQCGDGATCQCDSGGAGCACTPNSCVNNPNPPPGCSN